MAKIDMSKRPEVTPEQMYEIAETLTKKAFSDEKLTSKLQQSKLLITFKYHDEEMWGPDVVTQVTVDLGKDPVGIIMGPTDIQPTIEMSMDAITAHLFFMQKVNLMSAITRGQIKAKGPINKAMRLLPLLKPLYTAYRETLKELGREDLLNFPPD